MDTMSRPLHLQCISQHCGAVFRSAIIIITSLYMHCVHLTELTAHIHAQPQDRLPPSSNEIKKTEWCLPGPPFTPSPDLCTSLPSPYMAPYTLHHLPPSHPLCSLTSRKESKAFESSGLDSSTVFTPLKISSTLLSVPKKSATTSHL